MISIFFFWNMVLLWGGEDRKFSQAKSGIQPVDIDFSNSWVGLRLSFIVMDVWEDGIISTIGIENIDLTFEKSLGTNSNTWIHIVHMLSSHNFFFHFFFYPLSPK